MAVFGVDVVGLEEVVVVRVGGVGVYEVGAGLGAAHGAGGAVVCEGGLLRRVEGAKPTPFLRLRVADLGSVAAPGAASDAAIAHGAAGAGGIAQPALGGGAFLGVVVGEGCVGVLSGAHSVETTECFFHYMIGAA